MKIYKTDIELGNLKKESLNELLWKTIVKYPDIIAFRYRHDGRQKEISYQEFGAQIKALSLGLMSLGLKKGDKVSLLAETRYEWSLADFAILTAGAVTVTIYPTLSSKAIRHIVDDSGSKIIILEDRNQLDKILSFRKDITSLKYLIMLEPKQKPANHSDIYALNELMEKGREHEKKYPQLYEETWRSVKPEDLSSFVYSSGTTGIPKGVMLSHWNWRFNIYSMFTMSEHFQYEPGDALLAFLPLAHVYMRLILFIGIHVGATTYFSKPAALAEALPEVRPRGFGAVPRLWERIYEKIHEEVAKSRVTKRMVFYRAEAIAKEMGACRGRGEKPSAGLKLKHSLANKLVFSRIREATGLDRVQLTVSSGSSLRKELAYFFSGLEIRIIEGYGMTETGGPTNINPPESEKYRPKPGTVGPPLPGTMQMIAEDGEILVKGDNVMLGYHNLPQETRKTITADGWLKTGDMGTFDKDGYLIFTERKKHIIVLSTGKNVAPLPIEEKLKKNRWIEEVVLIGDDRKYISAIIQPNYELVLDFAEKNNLSYDKTITKYMEDMSGDRVPVKIDPLLLKDKSINDIIESTVQEANREFESFEQVGKFILIDEAVVDELTPTLKVKKNVIIKKYAPLIEELYGVT